MAMTTPAELHYIADKLAIRAKRLTMTIERHRAIRAKRDEQKRKGLKCLTGAA